MEFILQLIADLFVPIDENEEVNKITTSQSSDSTEAAMVAPVSADESPEGENIFSLMEFH